MEFFEDLRIVSFDDSKVQVSRRGPPFKRLALVLSSEPPKGWASILQSKYSAWTVDKRIEVAGCNVWVDCRPEDLQAVLDDLKPLIAQTNTELRAELARLKREQEERDQAVTDERERFANIKKKLNFD